MWSRGRPEILAPAPALSRADTTRASCITSRGVPRAAASGAFSSIRRVSSAWSRLPQLTPMRTGLSWSQRDLDHGGELAVASSCRSRRCPGLIRYFASASAQSGILGQQPVAVVVEVADQGHVAAHRRPAARGSAATAAAASGVLTVMRTSSEPAAPAPRPASPCRRRRRCPCWSSTARRWAHRHRPSRAPPSRPRWRAGASANNLSYQQPASVSRARVYTIVWLFPLPAGRERREFPARYEQRTEAPDDTQVQRRSGARHLRNGCR